MKAIIIGAGIGGLLTAIALRRKGFEVAVYEQADELREVGAGISIAPNALKIVKRLGLAEKLIEKGKVLKHIYIMDTAGRLINEIDNEQIILRHEFPTISILRADIQNIFMAELPPSIVHVGKRYISCQQHGDKIIAQFEEAENVEADLLVCADGIHSKARKQICPESQLRYSGQTCWRFVCDHQLPPDWRDNLYEVWSRKKGLRIGCTQVNDSKVYMYITDCRPKGEKDNPETLQSQLLDLCAQFPSPLKDIIREADPSKIIRNDLLDFSPINQWYQGRLCLLGDSAHATTPNLGQGACQAMEDAYALSEELANNPTIELALGQYQKKRIGKAKHITNTSYRFAQIVNLQGPLKSLVIWLIRHMPESINQKQLDLLYKVD